MFVHKSWLGQLSGQRLTGTIQWTTAHDWDNPADKDYWDNSVDKSTRLEQPGEERLIGVIQRTKVYDWENPADKGSWLGQPSRQTTKTKTEHTGRGWLEIQISFNETVILYLSPPPFHPSTPPPPPPHRPAPRSPPTATRSLHDSRCQGKWQRTVQFK